MGKHSPWAIYHSKTRKYNLEMNFTAAEKNVNHRKTPVIVGENQQWLLGRNGAGKTGGHEISEHPANPGHTLGQPESCSNWCHLISLKRVFLDLTPDSLLFWDLSLLRGGEGSLRTCCHSFKGL